MNINATLLGQAVSFVLFVIFCAKFVWPPVVNALRERQKNIADGLEAASRAESDLELAKKKASEMPRPSSRDASGSVLVS